MVNLASGHGQWYKCSPCNVDSETQVVVYRKPATIALVMNAFFTIHLRSPTMVRGFVVLLFLMAAPANAPAHAPAYSPAYDNVYAAGIGVGTGTGVGAGIGVGIRAGFGPDTLSKVNPAAPKINPADTLPSPDRPQRWSNPPGSPPRDSSITDRLSFFSNRILQSMFGKDISIPASHVIPPHQAGADYRAMEGRDSITWIGHSTFLIRMDGMTILTDPFFGERASPFSWMGPQRLVPPAIAIEDLPPIDIIIISHSHYDHLDAWTVENLANSANIHVVVPEGLQSFFTDRGYIHVTALQWWQNVRIGPIIVRAFPAVHWSKRSLFDTNETLWMSYGIESERHVLYHSGDTERHDNLFRQIGEKLGRCDLALMAIGAYEPQSIMRGSHMNPEAAVDMARDIGCTKAIGHHWGTIALGDEPFFEPITRFLAAGQNYPDMDAQPMIIGQTLGL